MSTSTALEKAIEKVRSACDQHEADYWAPYLREFAQLEGADAMFRRIADADTAEAVRDYLAEAKFALLLTRLGFQVRIEPHGTTGPDLEIRRNGRSALLEVHRFRAKNSGPPDVYEALKNPESMEYGDFEKDFLKARDAILNKFRQVGGDQDAIIAFWNDDERLERDEVEEAVSAMAADGRNDILALPDRLHGVLLGSGWRRVSPSGTPQQFFYFKIKECAEPLPEEWAQEFESALLSTLLPPPSAE